jgi:lysyl-tRNA synthetase class 2
MNTPISDDLVGQRQRRIEKVKELRALGINPYPSLSQKDVVNTEILNNFEHYEGKKLTLAGRLISWREHGKLIFADIQDQSGKIQLWLKQDGVKGELSKGYLNWEQLKLLDAGDYVQATGVVVKTSRGAVSLDVSEIRILAKSLRPLPQKLEEKEQLVRKRYLDLTLHPEKKALFIRKAKFYEVQREFLLSKGFMEVETPVLEHVTGGGDARPFATHHNFLDEDFYLRISTELYQKRLIGAGFEKIFTIGPNFRNEGLSDEHLQEYYQIEWYWAFANYRDNMSLVKELFREIAQKVYGKTEFETRGHKFDLASEWQEISYPNIIKEKLGIDIFKDSDEKMLTVLKAQNVKLSGEINRSRLVDNLWKTIRKTISGPAFLVNEPKFMSPLAKSKDSDESITERFHVILAGSELGNGYTEINDPQDQLERFMEQQKLREAGDDEAQMLDLDFVEMLEYAMPPTSGYGQSERIFWYLENVTAREGTLFPQLSADYNPLELKVYGESVLKHTKAFAKENKKAK